MSSQALLRRRKARKECKSFSIYLKISPAQHQFLKREKRAKKIFSFRVGGCTFFLCEYILVRERLLFCTFDVLFPWSIKIVINRFVRAINLYWVYSHTATKKYSFYPNITFVKSHFLQNSHFEDLTFWHFTFVKSYFS